MTLLLNEPKFTLDQAAEKLGMSRRTFDANVKGKLRLIVHNARRIEVPQSSLEAYLQGSVMLGTPPVESDSAEKKPAASKKPSRSKKRT